MLQCETEWPVKVVGSSAKEVHFMSKLQCSCSCMLTYFSSPFHVFIFFGDSDLSVASFLQELQEFIVKNACPCLFIHCQTIVYAKLNFFLHKEFLLLESLIYDKLQI